MLTSIVSCDVITLWRTSDANFGGHFLEGTIDPWWNIVGATEQKSTFKGQGCHN